MKTTSTPASRNASQGAAIIIYTDGSSLGNPGPGGYGCVIVFQDKLARSANAGEGKVVELGGHAKNTTNNKMELTAIASALEYLKQNHVSQDTDIVIHTDSSYAINGITKWVFGWQKNNWMTSTKTPVLNSEIWKQLVPLEVHFKHVQFHHVRGHAGVWGNERCDVIATTFASGAKLELFNGLLSNYDERILSKSTTMTPSKKSAGNDKKSGKAYSYVAQVNGKVYTFSDWESCKATVHGRSSKYKKVFSKAEEDTLKKEWAP